MVCSVDCDWCWEFRELKSGMGLGKQQVTKNDSKYRNLTKCL